LTGGAVSFWGHPPSPVLLTQENRPSKNQKPGNPQTGGGANLWHCRAFSITQRADFTRRTSSTERIHAEPLSPVVFKRPRVVQPSARHSRAQIDTPAPFNFNNTHPPPSMKAKASHPLKKALIAVNPKATPAEVKVAPAIAKKKKKRKNPKAADKRR
jgi:hypothetical protein